MTVNDTPMPNGPEATPQRSFLARSALLAGGAATGLVASALAGFGLVGLMFPNAGLPGTGSAPLTAAAYMPAPVSVTVMPETRVVRVEPTLVPAPVVSAPVVPAPIVSAPVAVAPASVPETIAAPAAPVPAPAAPARSQDRQVTASAAPVETTPATAPRATPPSGATTEERVAAPAPAPAPETRPVIATKSAALVDPDTAGIDTSGYGPRIAALPTAPESAPAVPTPANPEDFAMLADDDAKARAGAGLFTGPSAPPPAAAETAPETAVETAADPEPARPARRPEGFADQVAAIAPPVTSAAPASSIRPAPRPEIQFAAAQAPAAPAGLAAPTNVIEVAARQGSGGFLSGGSSDCGRSLARAIPARRGGATGTAFFAGLGNVSGPDRDDRAITELARGNMPSFLRELQPVTFTGQDARGANVEITICVTPDYLALGSDQGLRPRAPRPARGRADRRGLRHDPADAQDGRRDLCPGRREALARADDAGIADVVHRLFRDPQRDDRAAAPGPPRPGRRPQERRGDGEPDGLGPGPGRDLRLAPEGRRADPAGQHRARRQLRRLQPRHPAGERRRPI